MVVFVSLIGAAAIYAGVASAIPMDYGAPPRYELHPRPIQVQIRLIFAWC